MTLPNAPAAAYDGYIYTELICQEYGQQPRYYQVRNPIPGSDWRNDGGWAIVLERSAHFQETEYAIGNVSAQGGSGNSGSALQSANGEFGGTQTNFDFPRRYLIKGNNYWGFVTGFGRWVVIDRNRDGLLTRADIFWGGSAHHYSMGVWRVDQEAYNYGTSWIRWANMLWCR